MKTRRAEAGLCVHRLIGADFTEFHSSLLRVFGTVSDGYISNTGMLYIGIRMVKSLL